MHVKSKLLVNYFYIFAGKINQYMKKIILSALAFFAFNSIIAQETPGISGFSAGDIFLSGSVSYHSSKTGDIKADGYAVSPKAGYFMTNNLVAGLRAGYAASEQTIADPTSGALINLDVTSYELGLFGRYYFTPARRLSFFGELSLGYAATKTEQAEGNVERENTSARAGLSPGISFFVSEHIALEATYGFLGYNQLNPDGPADNTDTFTVGTSLSNLNFGIVYKF